MVKNSIKKEVWIRDGGKCIFCGSKQLEKTPHHAFFKSSYFGKDRNDAWNLILICQNCHLLIHFASNDIEAEKGKKLTKKCQEIAIGRYEGENLDKLKIIMREKYKGYWKYRK